MSHAVTAADLQRAASDTRLTLEARAMLFYVMTRPADYRMSVADLMAGCNARKDRVYSRVTELIATGYVTRKLIRRGAEYTIHPVPLSPVEGMGA